MAPYVQGSAARIRAEKKWARQLRAWYDGERETFPSAEKLAQVPGSLRQAGDELVNHKIVCAPVRPKVKKSKVKKQKSAPPSSASSPRAAVPSEAEERQAFLAAMHRGGYLGAGQVRL